MFILTINFLSLPHEITFGLHHEQTACLRSDIIPQTKNDKADIQHPGNWLLVSIWVRNRSFCCSFHHVGEYWQMAFEVGSVEGLDVTL